jgi:hypothetical protein
MAETLIANKIDSVKKLAGMDIGELTAVPGIGETTGKGMIKSAGDLTAAAKPPEQKREKKEKGKKNKKNKKGKKNKNKKGKKNKK